MILSILVFSVKVFNLHVKDHMPKYVIERSIPGIGSVPHEKLQEISNHSAKVLSEMGNKGIVWLHSYVTEDKIYCVYVADNEDLIREHGKKGEFPVTKISKVAEVIDLTTGGR
jgi:hypothetical protein